MSLIGQDSSSICYISDRIAYDSVVGRDCSRYPRSRFSVFVLADHTELKHTADLERIRQVGAEITGRAKAHPKAANMSQERL